MSFEEILQKIENKSKTVHEIRRIYSEVNEEGHKWIHVEDVKSVLKDMFSTRIKAHSYEDGTEIQVNIMDWDSSTLLTFGSEKEYLDFCKDLCNLQRHKVGVGGGNK